MTDITRKIHGTIKEAFDKAKEYGVIDGQKVAFPRGKEGRAIPDVRFNQPPVIFETKTGMQGLSHQYFLPPDLLPRELQEYSILSIDENNHVAHDRLSEVWGHLKRCNPDNLGQLVFDEKDTRKLYDVILGAASAFLPEDIQAWLNGWSGSALKENKEAERLVNKIEICCGSLHWVPSLTTLRDINRQMKEAGIRDPEIGTPHPRQILQREMEEAAGQVILAHMTKVIKREKPSLS